jgi:hypothetical protein
LPDEVIVNDFEGFVLPEVEVGEHALVVVDVV